MALLVLLPSFAQFASAAQDDGYSYDRNGGSDRNNADWMRYLPDSLSISNLSIPGTHDSGSWTVLGDWDWNTQSMSIERQLNAGVRALDIRCRYQFDRCDLFHGPDGILGKYLRQNLTDVLTVVTTFLRIHSGETVLMFINNPEGPNATDGSPNNNRTTSSFSNLFGSATYWNNPVFNGYFWKGSGIPTLSQVRGKIIVVQDFDPGQGFGLPGPRFNGFKTQNNYNIGTNFGLYHKWEQVKDYLIKANARTDSSLYLNFLSAGAPVFPYFVASGKSSPGTGDPILLTGAVSLNGGGPYPDFPRVGCWGKLCSIGFGERIYLRTDISVNTLLAPPIRMLA